MSLPPFSWHVASANGTFTRVQLSEEERRQKKQKYDHVRRAEAKARQAAAKARDPAAASAFPSQRKKAKCSGHTRN